MSTAEPSTVEPETAEAEVDSDEENEVLPKDDLAEEAKTEVVEDTTLANSDVTTKYQEAAKIVQATMVEMTKLVSIVRSSSIFTNYISFLFISVYQAQSYWTCV